MLGILADVITCAKFQSDIFREYDFTGGRISHFPIDFCMGLTTVQRCLLDHEIDYMITPSLGITGSPIHSFSYSFIHLFAFRKL